MALSASNLLTIGNAILKSLISAKGQIIVGTGVATVDTLATATNNYVLTLDSSTPTGLKWAATQSGTTDHAALSNLTYAAAGHTGFAPSNPLATDTLWDTVGDLVVGTGVNTAAKLAKGIEGQYLKTGASTLEWATVSASGSYTIVSQSSTTYNATQTTGTIIILCDCTANAITVNLPTAVGNTAMFIVKKTAGNYDITIDANSTETIDGFLTFVISTLNQSEQLISNNANWFVT